MKHYLSKFGSSLMAFAMVGVMSLTVLAGARPFHLVEHGRITATPRDASGTVLDVVAEGDKVAARCSVRGKHEGDFMETTATQAPVEFTGIAIVRIDKGKIVEAWNNFDFMTMYKQIGHLS